MIYMPEIATNQTAVIVLVMASHFLTIFMLDASHILAATEPHYFMKLALRYVINIIILLTESSC